MNTNFADDIPLDLAYRAHAGTSFVPDKRAASERDGYAATLAADLAAMESEAARGGTLDLLPAEFARYRAGLAKRLRSYLYSRQGLMSTMITGPSGFPAARMQKRSDIVGRRLNEYCDFRARALAAMRRTLRPDLAPIGAGDDDAIERIAAKLERLRRQQALMKGANVLVRKFGNDQDAGVAALMAEGFSEANARRLFEPDFAGRVGFADYVLSNNLAEIRRLESRLTVISRNKALPVTEVAGERATVEDDPPANRVRLRFQGKPPQEVRTRLRRSGFRWAPTIGAWQAYRNDGTLRTAHDLAGAAVGASHE